MCSIRYNAYLHVFLLDLQGSFDGIERWEHRRLLIGFRREEINCSGVWYTDATVRIDPTVQRGGNGKVAHGSFMAGRALRLQSYR